MLARRGRARAHRAVEERQRDRPRGGLVDRVQQHADGCNAHQLLSGFTDRGVLHVFQSDEQRLEDIFNPGQHKAEQHERKRLCRVRIAENACCNLVAAQQQPCCACERKRKKH